MGSKTFLKYFLNNVEVSKDEFLKKYSIHINLKHAHTTSPFDITSCDSESDEVKTSFYLLKQDAIKCGKASHIFASDDTIFTIKAEQHYQYYIEKGKPIPKWELLKPNQKRSRIFNTLQNRHISFFFVCSQETKTEFFDKIHTDNPDYDTIRKELIITYLRRLKENVYAGNVKQKLRTLQEHLLIQQGEFDV